MRGTLADDIAQIAAPIYAVLLSQLFAEHSRTSVTTLTCDISSHVRDLARHEAVAEALALRRKVIEWRE